MHWFIQSLRKYAEFSGRASRPEYWHFVIGLAILNFFASLLDVYFDTSFDLTLEQKLQNLLISPITASGYISLGLLVLLLVPLLSVTARRLHDTGRSNYWLFLGLVPILGILVLSIMAGQEGQTGKNAYGENPKAKQFSAKYIKPS